MFTDNPIQNFGGHRLSTTNMLILCTVFPTVYIFDFSIRLPTFPHGLGYCIRRVLVYERIAPIILHSTIKAYFGLLVASCTPFDILAMSLFRGVSRKECLVKLYFVKKLVDASRFPMILYLK